MGQDSDPVDMSGRLCLIVSEIRLQSYGKVFLSH